MRMEIASSWMRRMMVEENTRASATTIRITTTEITRIWLWVSRIMSARSTSRSSRYTAPVMAP